MEGVPGNYINPILESDVGHMSFENIKKTYRA
jgi:hypothetical protein